VTTLHIVVTDHVHPGNSDVISRDSHGGDLAGNLPEHRLREAMGNQNQTFDLELLQGVDLGSLQSGVIPPLTSMVVKPCCRTSVWTPSRISAKTGL
jgi:hypothetical protein